MGASPRADSGRVTLLALHPPGDPYYPLASACLRGALLTSPLLSPAPVVTILNLDTRLGARELAARVLASRPGLLGVTCYIWDVPLVEQVARLVREADPGCVVVLGGPGAEVLAEELLGRTRAVEFVVRGEGEQTLPELVAELRAGTGQPVSTRGVYQRTEAGVRFTGARPHLPDLGDQPSPLRYGPPLEPDMTALLEASRGCPVGCHYCYWGSRHTRYLDLRRAEEDLALLFASGNRFRRLWYTDSIFNLNAELSKGILRAFIREGYRTHLTVFADLGLQRLEDELVDLMLEAGLSVLSVGLQSSNPGVLSNIGRPWKRHLFEENVRKILARRGDAPLLHLDVDLIYGLPGGSVEELRESFDYLFMLRPEIIHCFRLQILPGTRLYEERERHGFHVGTDGVLARSTDWPEAELTRADRFASGVHSLYNMIYDFEHASTVRAWLARMRQGLGVRPSELIDVWSHFLSLRHGLEPAELAKLPSVHVQSLIVDFLVRASLGSSAAGSRAVP